MRALHGLAILLLVAGCMAPAHQADSPVTAPREGANEPRPHLDALKPMPAVTLGRADVGSEPNIALAPDGTLYVSTPLQLWRSLDDGKSYAALGQPTCPIQQISSPVCPPGFEERNPGLVGPGDSDLAVDSRGGLHWVGLGGTPDPITHQVSNDRGETFGRAVGVSGATGFDRPWTVITPEDHLFVAWHDKHGYAANRSPDAGRTWLGKVAVNDGQPTNALAGPIVYDPSNHDRLYIPWVSTPPNAPDIRFGAPTELQVVRSDDAGANWTRFNVTGVRGAGTDVFSSIQVFPVVTVDAVGTLYMVVSQRAMELATPKPASQFEVDLLVSKDHGTTWSKPIRVSDPLKVAVMPWIVAGKAGRVAIGYYENTVGLPNENLPDLWNVVVSESVNADQNSPALRVGPSEQPSKSHRYHLL